MGGCGKRDDCDQRVENSFNDRPDPHHDDQCVWMCICICICMCICDANCICILPFKNVLLWMWKK